MTYQGSCLPVAFESERSVNRKGCGSWFVSWRKRAHVQAESKQMTGEDQTVTKVRQATVNESEKEEQTGNERGNGI